MSYTIDMAHVLKRLAEELGNLIEEFRL